MSRRRFLRNLALLPAAAGGFAHRAGAQEPTRLRFALDWRFDGAAAPFLMAQSKGYFKQENLDVTIDVGTGSSGTVLRIASGNYDMGFGDFTSLAEFKGNNAGQPNSGIQAVYMTYEQTPACIFAFKKSGIAKPSDLEGKTVGAPLADAGRKAFPVFARSAGFDAGKVKWATVDASIRETMLVKGDYDAITGYLMSALISLIARGVKEEDLNILKWSDYGVQLYGNAVMASPRFMAERPQAVAGFLRAYNRGLKESIANPEAAVQFVKQREPTIDDKLEVRRLKLVLDNFVVTPTARSRGLGVIDKLRMERSTDAVLQAITVKSPVDTDSLFNSSFLPPPAERRIT